MSDIDRIAYRLVKKLFAEDDVDAACSMARAALLEYGAIVREECAKACDDEAVRRFEREANPLPGDENPMIQGHKGVTARMLGVAIRKMNAHQD